MKRYLEIRTEFDTHKIEVLFLDEKAKKSNLKLDIVEGLIHIKSVSDDTTVALFPICHLVHMIVRDEPPTRFEVSARPAETTE